MASYQTLDIAVKIGGNLGRLDDLADKLDKVDRKAKQVRNIPINVDVDGDSEAVGRLSGVQTAAEAADDDVDIDVATSGGMDAQNRLSSILTDLGDLQGRTVELASRLDFDESYVNDSLDSLRENLRGANVEDLGQTDIREYQQQLGSAVNRFDKIESELYVDTSDFQDKVVDIKDRLRTAVLGEDSLIDREYGLDTEVNVVNAEQVFNDLSDQLQSSITEVEVDVSDIIEQSSIPDNRLQQSDVIQTIERQYEGEGRPSVDDLTQTIDREYEDVDSSLTENLSQRIEQEFGDVDSPSIEDVTRHVQTVFDEYEVPHVPDQRLTVQTDFEDTSVPTTVQDLRASIESGDLENAIDQTQRLQQQFDELDRPALEQRSDTLQQSVERSLTAEGDVDTSFLQSQLSNLENQVYEVDPTVDVEPQLNVDTGQLDTDQFSETLHSLGQNLSDERQFYTEMGVNVEQTYEDLGELHREFTADVNEGELDTDRLSEYRSEMEALQDRLKSVSQVDTKLGSVTSDIDRLGENVREFRTGETDLTQSLEQGQFRNRIETVQEDLRNIQQSVVASLDSDATIDTQTGAINTEVSLEDNQVLQRITAMRAALTALDDTVVDVDTNAEGGLLSSLRGDESIDKPQLAQRLDSFQRIAEREGQLIGTERESLTDFGSFETTFREHEQSPTGFGDMDLLSDLSSTLQQSFDTEDSGFAPLEHEDISRTRMDQLRSGAVNLIGPSNYAQMRGENAFSPDDFIQRGFNAEDLIDPDTSLNAEDIFDFKGRELTDVFESERSFRGYLNPDTDTSLGDAMREDRSFVDLGGDRGGISGQLEKLGDVDMSTFYDAAAKVVPQLLTFAGAMPAAIGGLIALGGAGAAAAASLAAIGGLAIGGLALTLGNGNIQKGLEEIRKNVVQDAKSAFAPLSRRFQDLGQDALDGVGAFFDRLATEATALTSLKDEARAFGEYVFNNVPAAVDDVVALAQAFAPLFAQGGKWLQTTDIVGAFVAQAQESLPAILKIVDAFLTMLPVIMDFSTGMLHATAMVFRFWQTVWSAIDALGPMAEGLGVIIGVGLSLYTTLMLLNFAFGALGSIVGTSVVGTLWSYAIAASAAVLTSSTLSGVLTYLAGTSLVSAISGFLSAIPVIGSYITASTAATVATYGLAAAIAATGIGALIVGVGLLSSQFLGTSGSIQEATKSLKDFKKMRKGMGGEGINNPYGPLEHDDMTNIDPNAPTKSGVQGETTVNNTNVTNNTEVKVPEGTSDPQKMRQEMEHHQFRQKENSSKPY